MLAWVVDMASNVVTPSATLAGTCKVESEKWKMERKVENEKCKNISLTALWSSQKDIQETETVMEQGT